MQRTQSGELPVDLTTPPLERRGRLPAVVEPRPLQPQRRWRPRVMLLALLLMIGAGAATGWVWWQHRSQLPPGIAAGMVVWSPTRSTSTPSLPVASRGFSFDEGDMVAAGQVVAMMDTKDLEASLKKSEAMANLSQRARRG